MGYLEHSSFKTPSDNTIIYRYMSFTKYMALLVNNALYFSPATDFEDKFEGAPGIAPNIQSLWMRRMKQFILISSWQQSNHESLAMWKIYLNSDEGIAIKTTIGKLKESLNKSKRPVYIGTVNYIDYDKVQVPSNNIFSPYLYKQLSFSYEQECRAIINLMPDNKGDFIITDEDSFAVVDLKKLVDEVIISPFSPEWFSELVETSSEKYNLSAPIKASSLKNQW